MLKRAWTAFACTKLPCAMCHASSILPLDEHTVLCAFFGGSFEGKSDTAIWLARMTDGQSAESVKLFSSNEAHWNPVLFTYPDGHIGIIFKVGDVIASWRSYFAESFDGGLTFSAPKELVKGDFGGRGPVRNQPLVLKEHCPGRYLSPASLEDGIWRAFADISDDGMRTFRKSNEVTLSKDELNATDTSEKDIAVSAQSFKGRGVIQPTFWEDPDGVHMLLRSTAGFVMRSDSKDAGNTWCDPYRTDVPNNNSGIDLDVLNGRIYLACNPVKGNWGQRSPISLLSSDDGIHFVKEEDMDSEAAEFSYPCVNACNEALYVSYTYKRKNIRVIKFTV